MGIAHFEGDVMVPFVCLRKKPDVDPKFMKKFPERMDLLFYGKIIFRAAHSLAVTRLFHAYE
jgi:hypothetical protein